MKECFFSKVFRLKYSTELLCFISYNLSYPCIVLIITNNRTCNANTLPLVINHGILCNETSQFEEIILLVGSVGCLIYNCLVNDDLKGICETAFQPIRS